MASPTQLVQFTFAGGIDESLRAEVLDPSVGFVNRENMRQPTKGSGDKRHGFDAFTGTELVDATTRTAGYRMFAHGKQTCIIDRDIIAAYSPDNDDQIPRGRVPECGLSMMKVPTPGVTGSLTCTDSIRVGDYLALAYTAGQSVYASLIEAETGQVIVAPTLLYTGSAAEIYGLLAAQGNTIYAFIICSGETDIQKRTIDVTSATTAYAGWSTSGVVAVLNGGLAMAVHTIGTRLYVAYVNNSGGASQITVEMYDGGAGGTASINTSSVTPSDLALGGDLGDTLWVAWNESTAIKVKGLSTTSMSTTFATTATVITAGQAPFFDGIAVVASSTAASGRLFVNNGANDRLYTRNFTTSAGAVSASGSTASHFNVQMIGRPFRVGTRYYGVCQGYDTTEKVAVLCDLTEANAWVRPVANVAPRRATGIFLAQAAQHTTREFWAPIGVQTAGNVTGVQMARFDFDAEGRWRPVAHNGVTFLSGGLVSYFDGVRVAESNFVIRPPVPTFTSAGTGITGSFRYVAVYEQVDAAGNWHLSGVSPPMATGSITDDTITVTVRPLGISGRISAATDPSVRISLYRTATGGEPPYYYLTSLTNTLTAATQTYADSTADGTLTSRALLMGTGNLPNTGAQLDKRAPQGMAHLCAYNGFLAGALGEEVFWTGQEVDGEGVWWNDNMSAAVTGGGDITALEAQDGTLYVFKRDRIFAMAGQPPNDAGTDGGLGAPHRLAVSVGASSPFTCVTEIGIFFISPRGPELLTRARDVEFIGEKIKDTFASYPDVSAVTYDAASSCVLIEASAGRSAGLPTGSGRTFVYDLQNRSWTSFDRRSVSASTDVAASDACVLWDGNTWRYAWLRADGATYVEADHYLDPGDVWVTKRARTASVKMSGIQGQQIMNKVLLLAKSAGNANISMAAAYDYTTTLQTPREWTSTVTSALSGSLGRIQLGHDLHDEAEGQAVAVEIADAEPESGISIGRGPLWIALTFEGQPRPNAALLPEEAR